MTQLARSQSAPPSAAGAIVPENPAEAVAAAGLRREISSGGERVAILNDLDLGIRAGESLAIVGRSGSGKTTLLSLLAGLDLPDAGSVRLLGQDLGALDEDGRARLRAGRVGFVFQSFQLLAGLTALENVMLPAELSGRADARERARAMLVQVGLEARLGHYPPQLSGGEQQRVALARAFAAEPEILFADEPTGNLDGTTGSRIIELMFELNRSRGTTLVLVTHDTQLAQWCGRTVTLEAGKLR